jgi:hypothetical protein
MPIGIWRRIFGVGRTAAANEAGAAADEVTLKDFG